MATQQVLVIEDDPGILGGIVDSLEFSGYRTLQAADGRAGLALGLEAAYDLMLLDLMLPEVDGLEILRQVRRVQPTVPIIILTARGEESDRVRGLEEGADDYVVKPFSVRELLARVGAVLRRSPQRPSHVRELRLPEGTADFERCELRFDDQSRCDLSPRETELLRYLAEHAGRAIAREELLANVWRIDPRGVSTRTVDMQIARLREKLRDGHGEPKVLLTVRGKGYMLATKQGAG